VLAKQVLKLQDNAKVVVSGGKPAPDLHLEMPLGASLLESVTPVYIAAGCDLATDGRNSSGRYCQLYATTSVGATAG
jgi:hypothetical protein